MSLRNAAEWYDKAAKQGNMYAQNNLATLFLEGRGVQKSYEKAFELFTASAKQGFPYAFMGLGQMYEYGFHVKKSKDEAIKWYTKASTSGCHEAIECLEHIGGNDNGISGE